MSTKWGMFIKVIVLVTVIVLVWRIIVNLSQVVGG